MWNETKVNEELRRMHQNNRLKEYDYKLVKVFETAIEISNYEIFTSDILYAIAKVSQFPDGSLIHINDIIEKNNPAFSFILTKYSREIDEYQLYSLRKYLIIYMFSKMKEYNELPFNFNDATSIIERKSELEVSLRTMNDKMEEWAGNDKHE